MKTKLLLFISIFAFIFNGFSQQIWKQNTTGFQARIAENPKKYKSLTLDKKLFLSIVKNVSGRTSLKKKSSTILLPVENNTFEAFEILEASNFSKELASKFPAIKSYVGKSTSSNKVARFSYSKYNGLTAFITTNHGTILVKPTNLKANAYVAFNKSDSEPISPFECGVTEKVREVLNKNHAKAMTSPSDGYLRKYRLALATTGEYSNYFLTGSETSDAERKAVVLAALNTTLTRINGIFERDFGVTLELIPTNDRIIHLEPNTDPFGGIGFSLLPVVQSHLDAEIGAANYDIGHVLAYRFRNFGAAYVAVCMDGFPGKGSAFSSGPNLASDDFIVTVFAHELGHQLGTDHVQSSSSCRSIWEWDTAVEPGSGSTIMGYAGICNPNVQSSPDSYFNHVSIRDVKEFTAFRGCGELISTGNNTPTVNAGSNYTIPKSTPFSLEGSGDDVDNNSALTYTWEQNDPENPNSSSFPQPGWTRGPLFRSLPPTDVPLRYIPKLEDVVSGNLTPTWEVLPSVSRTMDFVLTVRDNAAFGPKTASDEMTVTVDGSSGPFAVTSQNSSVAWEVGELRTITWNVANTNQAPVNATTVAMYLSTDGGYTYPIEVATNVPNNGSYDIIVPEVPASTATARLMVRAENNIFYSINASDINVDLSGFSMSFSELEKDVCKGDGAVFVFNYKTFLGFNETTAFSIENLPNGVEATFNPPAVVNNNTAVNVTISGLENLDLGANELIVTGNTISKQRKARLKLNLFENPDKPTLVSPENNALQIIPHSTLVWEADQNAETYTIELATDPGFSNILEQTTTTENTFTPSQTEFYTSYYWRVKSDNGCGTSDFSDVFTFKTKCNDPANITITDITHHSATISWTDDFSPGWEIRIIENASTPIERIIATSTSSNIISSLNSSTDYDVFVRSLCTSDFSSWIGPGKFTTPASCPAPTDFVVDDITFNVANLSWTSNGSEALWELEYGLEGFTPGTGTKVLATTNPYALEGLDEGVNYEAYLKAICGSNPGDDDSNWIGPVQFKTFVNYCEAGKFYDNGGPGGNYREGLFVEVISSPGENIPLTVTFNTFDLAEGATLNIYGPDFFRETYRGTDSPGTVTSEIGELTFHFFSNGSETSAGWDATVICGALSCPMPSDFVAGNTTTNTVDLSWTSNGSEPQWELEYGVAGFVQGQGTRVLTSTNLHSLAGLSAGTDYRVYLKAICGPNSGDDDSPWVGPLDFTTPASCPAPSDFVVDDITSDVVNLSWTNNGSEALWELEYGLEGFAPGTGTKVLTATNPYALEGLDAGVNYEVYLKAICGSGPGDDDSFIIGPVRFKIPINDYCEAGRFYDNGGPGGNYREGLFIEVISSPGENIPLTVAFNAFDLAEGATLHIYGPDFSRETYRGTDSPGTITSEIGELTFHFYSDGSETSAGWDATVICGSLSCPIPSDFVAGNTTANTVDLSWTSNGSEPQWELEYGVAGFVQGQGTRVLTSTNPHSLAGLSAGTDYRVYLKAVCGTNSGDDDSPWVGPLDFTTPASCPAPTDFVIDEITSNSANLSWTSNGSEIQWKLEYGVAGFVQGQGTKVLTSTNPHTLEGLSADTNYKVYLKAICGSNPGDDDSSWVGALDFTTPVSCPGCSNEIRPFITTWQITADQKEITIPTHSDSGPYNYTIDWGDGTIDTGQTGDATHTYAEAKEHQVKITGDFPHIHFNGREGSDKIQAVTQWGDIQWKSMQQAFKGCSNLEVTATDVPNLSQVEYTSEMFSGATSFNQDISGWNVSSVTDMHSMFQGATSFNQDIRDWDVSSVTIIRSMFSGATSFNQDISGWDMSNITSTASMFEGATSFNQDIGSWDMSSVIDMNAMFKGAAAFNQDLGSWTSHAINRRDMFDGPGLDCANYSATLFGWVDNTSVSNVQLGADGMEYGTDVYGAINELITNRNWTINGHKSSGSKCLPFEIDRELVTGTVTPLNARNVQVYPNPAKEQLNIVLDSNHGKIQQVVIRVVPGQVLRRKTVSHGDLANEGVLSMDISNLATGLYLLEVHGTGASSIFRTKFFKQ